MRHAFHGPKRHALRRHTFKRHSAAFIVLALAFSTLAFTGAFTGEARAAGDGRKGPGLVVVELYTSQSCSSCPPADKFLGELAKRKDILALSMHVDYWNVLGWRDPWSSADVTARQRRYMRSLGARYVSTPQAIIGGESYAVGSNRPAVFRLIEKARRAQRARVQPIVTMPVPGRLTVTLPDVKLAAPARASILCPAPNQNCCIVARTLSHNCRNTGIVMNTPVASCHGQCETRAISCNTGPKSISWWPP